MDIDLATDASAIVWKQAACPWNAAEGSREHRCAVKNTSLCPYFCGVEYIDTLLCCYPHENPLAHPADGAAGASATVTDGGSGT